VVEEFQVSYTGTDGPLPLLGILSALHYCCAFIIEVGNVVVKWEDIVAAKLAAHMRGMSY